MCTYNGEPFLAEQLDSFERQTHSNWSLMVSDDGSLDGTSKVLEGYRNRWGHNRLMILEGPKRGFAANFLSLTSQAHSDADFLAWADQDDIWNDDKLEAALAWLQTVPAHRPALYCGRTELVGETGTHLGYSPHFRLAPSFCNALVQSIAGGNTMVFNQAARTLLCEAGADLKIPAHDWWLYQLITGAGGVVHYDPEPKMKYRQHTENVVGNNSGWLARLIRLRMVFQGRFHEWNEQNIQALDTMHHRLSSDNQMTLAHFKRARKQKILRRISGIWLAGLYRQTLLGNFGLILATVMKKI
ncbi:MULTISPECIES: glycosyltransferase family 2 protein [unclassified Pseudomonas]|uniref:glycosyltransferase family 2 protein n=1 Tax=unclassified Pseudomonas TaxID=196821 RepID=UPI000CD1923E|nr:MULTISPECIES: glycosyltransferase family 2 protein [unclassified Pseudomonas]POA55194.1 glycosyl transferase family 2 [Pseudomonas sp. FW507-12TSA]